MSNGQLHFLIRPDICNNESIPSYLERICIANKYSNTSWIRKLLDSSVYQVQNNLISEQDIRTLELLLGKCMKDLSKHGLVYWCTNLFENAFDKYVLKNKVKYCPICITELPIHQFHWGFNQVCICLAHQCELVDSCLRCSSHISSAELLRGFCKKCGFNYANAKIVPINCESYDYQSQLEIQRAMFDNSRMLKGLGGIVFSDFIMLTEASFHLLEGLYCFITDKTMKYNIFKKKNTKYNNKKYLQAYSNVWWMYDDFPNNFRHVLEIFVSKKKRSHIYAQKGQFEKVLENFPTIKNAYADFWINRVDSGTVRKDLSLFRNDESVLKRRAMLSKEETRVMTGLSYNSIYKMADSGKVQMTIMKRGKQKRYIIDRKSLESTLLEADGFVNKKEAAEILGIQSGSVVDLIRAGLLTETMTPYAPYKKIYRQEVNNLLQKCRGKKYMGKVKLLTFHEALIKFSVCGLSIEKLLQFTIENKIRPKSKYAEGSLADNLYYESELEACVKELKKEKQNRDGYYVTDVMKLLKIGEKKMWSLITEKVIVPSKIIVWKDGRKRYLFEKEHVNSILINRKVI